MTLRACGYRFGHYVSKGQIIRRHGRAAWDGLPRSVILRDGRRAYVGLRDLLKCRVLP